MNKDEIDLKNCVILPTKSFLNAITQAKIDALTNIGLQIEFDDRCAEQIALGKIAREIEELKRSLI